jgi:hypothetical protein
VARRDFQSSLSASTFRLTVLKRIDYGLAYPSVISLPSSGDPLSLRERFALAWNWGNYQRGPILRLIVTR